MYALKNLDRFDLKLNYKELCTTLCKGEKNKVLDIFKEKTEMLLEVNHVVGYRLALNNLNYSIFNYLLFIYDISLTHCLYSNILILHTDIKKENFYMLADNILSAYYAELLDKHLVTKNPLIKSVLSYVDEHISEPIRISKLAEMCHVNSTYLSQTFKNVMGESFSTYLSEHRIHHAKMLLLQTDDNLDNIARNCGFSSSSYFSTVFMTKTGMTPSNYRKNHSLTGI